VALSVNPSVIVLLAAEPSGDALGATLAIALKSAFPEVRLLGMAGPQMRAAGVEPVWQMEAVSVMGLWEVLKHYPRLRRLQKSIMRDLITLRPSFVLGIDAPDFNLAIESRLKSQQIPVYHLVAPTVWAWRSGRAARLAQQTDGVLCLFPFEPPYFLLHDLRAVAVGHPLADRLPLTPDRRAARHALGIAEDALVLAVLPGSRASEWQYHASVFFATVAKLHAVYPTFQVLVPCLHERMQTYLAELVGDLPIRLVVSPQGASEVLTASDLALVVSGTATLEAALCHTPMVIAYQMHPVSWWIMSRMAKVSWAGLPNILANASIVPELLQEDMQVDSLAHTLGHLFDNPQAQEAQRRAFDVLHQQLRLNTAETAVSTLIQWWRDDVRTR